MSDQNTNEATKDVIVPATVPADTPVKFGFGQIGNATPQIINTIKRALNFFFGGAIIFLPAIASQFHTTTDNIATIFGVVMLFVNTIGIMFGVEPDMQQIALKGGDRPPVKPPTP
jgi:hypothetical protein